MPNIVTNEKIIAATYVALYQRSPDKAGLDFWLGEAARLEAEGKGGTDLAQEMANLFAQHPAFTTLYGGLGDAAYIDAIYVNIGGKVADANGRDYWLGKLTDAINPMTRAEIVGEFVYIILSITPAELQAQKDAGDITAQELTDALARQDRLSNKADVALLFTQTMGAGSNLAPATDPNSLASLLQDPAYNASKAIISGVTEDDATMTAPNAYLNGAPTLTGIITTFGGGVVTPGQTFTLTKGLDNVPGTAGNDTIIGTYDGAATGTFSVVDSITGGAGTDTLNITASDDAVVTLPAASVSGVEVINVRNVDGDATAQVLTVNAANFVGATAINSDRSSDSVTISNLATGASAGVIGNGVITNGAFVVGYEAAATAATLNISGGTKGGAVTVTGAGLTSATVNSTGAANTIGALTGAATTTSTTINATTNLTTGAVTNAGATLNITGAGAVNLSATALEAGVTKVDASANTGGVTVALGTAVTQTVTGGSGNDVITSGAVLTTGSVNAGAGTDTLVLGTNVAHANTAALAAKYTNFETLRVNGTFDASLIAGITAIELSGATNNISKLSATQAGAVTGLADVGATTLALATDTGTADVVSLTLGDGKGAAFDTGALTVNGIETLNIKANAKAGDADQTSVIASFTADKLTAINLTGSAVTLTNAATTKAVTIDGSALTGTGGATPVGLTVSGNLVTGSVVTGSAVGDVFTAGTSFATYNGGAGKDTFNATAAQLNTGADYNVINGGDGEDTLNITDGAAVAINIVDNNLSKVSGIEKIVITSTTTANQSIQTGGWFDAAFKAAGVDLTTTTTTGTIGIDMTSFSGAATLTTTSTTGNQTIQTGTTGGNDKITAVATTGNVTVTTGAGDDVVSVTTAGTGTGLGAITITTGAGNDTITVVNAAAGDNATITAGAGADKITLGTDAAKVVIGNTDSGITVATADTITGFKTTSDTIALGFAGGATNATEAAAAVTDFATALTNANAALAALKVANPASTELANFQWDATNGYLFNDTNADGTADQVIVLVGITGTTFAVADIVA